MTTNYVLMIGTFVCSVFTGLITEAIKKMINEPNNIIAAIVAIVVGACYGVGYLLMNNLPFNIYNIISVLLLIVCSWIVSMVGYDKFKQTIEQIINGNK